MAQEPYEDSQGLIALKQPPGGIRLRYDPPQEQKNTLRYVYKDRFNAMKEGSERQDVQKKWDKWQKQWEGFRDPRTIDSDEMWQSNHVSPITTSVVQTALAEMIDQEVRPFFLPQGIEKQAKTTLMQHIWDFAWWTAQSDLMMYDIYLDLLVYGTAIEQEYYRKEKRIVRDIFVGKNKKETLKERTVYDYDDVFGELVPLRDFWVDEKARSFDGAYAARDCIRRYVMDIDDFMLMYKDSDWDQYGNAKLVKPGGDLEYYEYYQPPHGIDLSREVEVLHYWAVKPYDRFVVCANDILIRDSNNPYDHKQLPFCRAVDIKKTNFFYGKGEPELLESIQDETDTLRRMVLDRNHLDIDKMFLVSNRIGLTDEDLIARPHGLIPTDDMNATKPIEYGDIPRSVELSIQNLETDSVIATGIDPRQQIPESSTATQASLQKEATLKRIMMKLWLGKKDYFPRMAELRTSNILQFYSQPRLEKIVGEEESQEYQNQVAQLQQAGMIENVDGEKYQKTYRQIQVKGTKIGHDAKGELSFNPTNGYTSFDLKPNDFMPLARGGYVIRFEAGSNIEISKPLMQSKDLELFDRFSQIALTVPGSYDIVKLGDMILRDYDKNPDDYKPTQAQGDNNAQQLQMLIQLAQLENAQMMQGKDVPATPFASPAHTRIHTTLMNSEKYQSLPKDDKIRKIFIKHVIGEIMAQEAREQAGAVAPAPGSQGAPPGTPPQGAAPMTAPPGQPPMNAAAGITNKPGGMAKPTTKIGDVMPGLNTGSSPQLP